jgi:catechol 2,3-dioxygenase-like lactoylglutathione lyase family enzyme
MTRFIAVVPVSDEDTTALPVKALDAAITFYQNVFGFLVVFRDASAATLSRDDVQIRLVIERDFVPARAGSLAIEVDDLDALHNELERSAGRPGEFGVDEWGGRPNRTFFVREDENGYCFCFYHPL